MGFAKLNKSRFSPAVYMRGEEYEEMGNVSFRSVSSATVNAVVDGTEPYEVHVEFSKDGHILRHECTCPYHSSGKLCKHIAAVLFAMDALPPGKILRADPGETETGVEDRPFAHAGAWSPNEFAQKSIEAFESILEEDNHDYHINMMFEAMAKSFKSSSVREKSISLYKIYTAIENVRFRETFLTSFFNRPYSGSLLSAFCARAIYSDATREDIQLFLNEHPKFIEELNSDLLSTFSPTNLFQLFNDNLLIEFANHFYFSFEIDEEYFVDACEQKKNIKALQILLDQTRLGRGPLANRVVDILKKNSQGSSIDFLIRGVINGSIDDLEFIKAYFKLSKEEQEACKRKIQFSRAVDRETIQMLIGEMPTYSRIANFEPDYLEAFIPIFKEKDSAYISNTIPKIIAKVAKRGTRYYYSDEYFGCLIRFIDAFSHNALVAMSLKNEDIIEMSFRSKSCRGQYLLECKKLGLLTTVGVQRFERE